MFPALQRFFEAVECRTQAELAEFLGIKQSSISDAKKRKTIPPDWLLTALRKKGIRPDWILTGQGARMLQSCDGMGMVVPLHVPILEISSFIGKQKKAGTHFLAMSPGLASFLWNNFH